MAAVPRPSASPPSDPTPRQQRHQRGIERRSRAAKAAERTGGVLTLELLRKLGITYDEFRAEVSAGRWHRVGRRAISVSGPLPASDEAVWWRALWDVGGGACLDGASALLAWGLKRWSEARVHVSVPRGARYHQTDGVELHVLRDRGRVVGSVGLGSGGTPPRTMPEVAALRAAMWARTDREAATVLAVGVQQGIVNPARLLTAWAEVGRCPRAELLSRLVPLVASGAQALSEIDFAELGRARGWPEPDRQVVVTTATGRIFLDVRFTAYDTICEVNGVQHYEGMAIVVDAVRRNSHVIDGHTALEIPAVGLVLDPEPLLDQVEQALRKGGWSCDSGPTHPAS